MARNQFVRISYSESTGKITNQERAARKRLETAIQTAMEEFHRASRSLVSGLEAYPCSADCAECVTGAA